MGKPNQSVLLPGVWWIVYSRELDGRPAEHCEELQHELLVANVPETVTFDEYLAASWLRERHGSDGKLKVLSVTRAFATSYT